LRVDEKGERIPLTAAEYESEKSIITISFQEVGYSTKLLGKIDKGDYIKDIVGPLGHHIDMEGYNKVEPECVASVGGLLVEKKSLPV
jgi:ferredoxin--NADP+ reductase